MSLESHKFVGLSYEPNDVRFGHNGDFQYFFERRRNQAILQGALRLFEIQTQYARSQSQAPSYTMLVHRDNLLAIALSLALRCIQTRDVLYTEMTTHAKRYWKTYGNNFWSSVPLFEDDENYSPEVGFAGVAGSLAFMLYRNQDNGAGLYPSQLLRRMLNYVWDAIGTSSETTPQQKQQDLIAYLEGQQIPFFQYQQALQKIYQTDLALLHPDLQQFLITMRRRMLTPSDWTSLRLRWVLGEYVDELLITIKELQNIVNNNFELQQFYNLPELSVSIIDNFNSKQLQAIAPAGPALFYIALAVESLLNVAQQITDTPELHTITYLQFLNQGSYQTIRRPWALTLSTAYDAMGVLGTLDTMYEAKGLAYRFFISALQLIQGDTTIEADGPTRLGAIL